MITSCKNWRIQGNSAKSTNKPMSSFGLSKENMELCTSYLLSCTVYLVYSFDVSVFEPDSPRKCSKAASKVVKLNQSCGDN